MSKLIYCATPSRLVHKINETLDLVTKLEVLRLYLGFGLSEAFRDGFEGFEVNYLAFLDEISSTPIEENGQYYIHAELIAPKIRFFYRRNKPLKDLKEAIQI